MIAKNKKIKKESWQNIIFSVILGIAVLVVVGYLIASNWKINEKRSELISQVETLQQQLAELEAKRDALQSQISQTTEEEYLEREARETFNLKKPGEEVVTVLPPEGESQQETERSFWQRIWDKIKF